MWSDKAKIALIVLALLIWASALLLELIERGI
jgi:hypothetical protein